MAQAEMWKAHQNLCKVYGDVVHLSVLGKHIIVLGSQQAIVDLLDKMSAATSDREQNPIIELSGQSFNFALFPYNHWWRRHRRVFSQHVPPTVPEEQLLLQEQYVGLFLRKLLTSPAGFRDHIRYAFTATIVKLVYGVDVAESDDPNVALMVRALEGVQGFTSGRVLVQYLPILRHMPLWVPVLGSQLRELAGWRAAADEVKQGMFDKTQDDLTQGHQNTSVLANILQELDEDANIVEEHLLAKNVCLTAFEGASDTTFSTIQAFFVAMALNPDIQWKAQAELESVIGMYRLPTHRDRASLPYVSAVLKESLRWHNVMPLGVPHYTSEDIEYRGYFIPKGTVLIANAWACLHDPDVYSDPDLFLPDRFIRNGNLDPSVRDPSDFIFGYGRRACAGQAFAEANMFMIIAMTLHVFDITPPLDEAGRPIQIQPKVRGSFVVYPADCRCTIRPRSAQAEALIVDSVGELTT
ncbi:cytochrome P450 [Lentinus tigrinus ALCF2SS1-7]|nr:cytochrome P450 [Lentinus tigrinus ALCF2SS1-7]